MSQPLTVCHVTDFLPGSHKIAGGAEYAVAGILSRQARSLIKVKAHQVPTTKRRS